MFEVLSIISVVRDVWMVTQAVHGVLKMADADWQKRINHENERRANF